MNQKRFKISYDQISDEEVDYFDTLRETCQFSIDMLIGDYNINMTQVELITELQKNGYYLTIQ